MKRSKFSEEQIAYVLRQVEAGSPFGEICRQTGVSEAPPRRLSGSARLEIHGGPHRRLGRAALADRCALDVPTHIYNARLSRAPLESPGLP